MPGRDGVANDVPPEGAHAEKANRVVEALRGVGADAVVIRSSEALAWLLDGARPHVPTNGAATFAARVDRAGSVRVFVPANELDRLVAEELPTVVEVTAVPWHASPVEAAHDGSTAVDESDLPALRDVRAALLDHEIERYRSLGRDAAEAMTAVAKQMTGASTELAVASALSAELLVRGIEPTVLLVGGARRSEHRHPIPTSAEVHDRAMLVVCGRRRGLIANLTRWVGRESTRLTRVQERLFQVEADILAATRVGASFASIYGSIRASYVRHGFGSEEIERHHQGGPTGYFGRDPKVGPTTPGRVAERQAFAWNPSGPGVKVEDTVIVGRDGHVEVLTADPVWPTTDVRGLGRPRCLASY